MPEDAAVPGVPPVQKPAGWGPQQQQINSTPQVSHCFRTTTVARARQQRRRAAAHGMLVGTRTSYSSSAACRVPAVSRHCSARIAGKLALLLQAHQADWLYGHSQLGQQLQQHHSQQHTLLIDSSLDAPAAALRPRINAHSQAGSEGDAKPAVAAAAAAAEGQTHPPGFVARRLVVFAGILLG